MGRKFTGTKFTGTSTPLLSRTVAEWLESLTQTGPIIAAGSNPSRDVGFFM